MKGDREPAPQVGSEPLPHHMGGVVVAVSTQRLPQQTIRPPALSPVSVHDPAGQRAAMGAAAVRVAGVAPTRGVDPAEEGAVRVANSSGWSATDTGTVLPPVTPARIRWNMSAAYSRSRTGLRRATVPAPHMHHAQGMVGAGES